MIGVTFLIVAFLKGFLSAIGGRELFVVLMIITKSSNRKILRHLLFEKHGHELFAQSQPRLKTLLKVKIYHCSLNISAASNNNTAVWLHSDFSSKGCQFQDNLFGNFRVSEVEKLSNSKYLSEKKN